MQDWTALEVSLELCQYIEALVEETVLKGKPFEDHKKYLSRFCGSENIDYNQLETNLKDLFEAAKELKIQESKESERLLRKLGKECYLSEDKIDSIISAVRKIRDEDDAKRKKEEERLRRAMKNRIPVKILLIILGVISIFEVFFLKWWCVVPLLVNCVIGMMAQVECDSGEVEYKKVVIRGLALASICFLLSFLHWWSLLFIPIATGLVLLFLED